MQSSLTFLLKTERSPHIYSTIYSVYSLLERNIQIHQYCSIFNRMISAHIQAIMAKMKLPKKPHSMVIFLKR